MVSWTINVYLSLQVSMLSVVINTCYYCHLTKLSRIKLRLEKVTINHLQIEGF